jgi:ABC-type transport system involved in cytochrome c biogenesis permease subunit
MTRTTTPMTRAARGLAASALAVALLLVAALPAQAAPKWDKETLQLFASIPVQDDGRVKPLDTLAQFQMLRIVGKRSFTTESKERLGHMEWYLNCLLYPEVASDYKCFIVDNSEAVSAIGVKIHDAKRDRYSYNELKEGREQLFKLAGDYSQKEKAQRTTVEQQVVNLANNVHEFETLIHFFDAAFLRFTATGDTETARAFPEKDGVPLSVALERIPGVLKTLQGKRATLSEEQLNTEASALGGVMDQMRPVQMAMAMALFPPSDKNEKEWRTPAELFERSLQFDPQVTTWLPLLSSLEKLPVLRDDPAAFRAELSKLHNGIIDIAQDRGEYSKVPIELHFYNWQYLWYSMYLYVFSFLLIAVSWLLPRTRGVDVAVFLGVALPTLLLIIGITLRCIIRSRPPVSTLYETVLFITAVAVLVALIAEFINRERIAIAVGSALGCMGMFLAFRYEAKDGSDTMPSLVAVLDTNFWLATHVTTVTMGYAAGLLAGALAHVYIIGQAWNAVRGARANAAATRPFYRTVIRMTYGVLCFGLLFSTVGTILGGIWANDSWGRFWGWDPKENGALMIVLWSLVVLHAKMGLYIRDLGVAACSVVLAAIVTFSWWGVNNLGVGLHSYGFTSGLWMWLGLFWAIECAVLLIALGVYLYERSVNTPPPVPAGKQASA